MSTEPRHASTRTRTPDRTTGGRFQRHRTRNDPRVRDELFARHLGLARHLARRYQGSGESPDDLLQIASIGLIKAIDRFDPDRGPGFASFAVPYILGELRRHFRDGSWAVRVPRPLKDLSLRVDAATRRLTVERGRAPTVAELADALDSTVERVLEAREVARAYRAVSYDGDDGDEAPVRLPSAIDDGYAQAEHRATLDPLLRLLSPLDREVVRLRFEDDLTQSEIAARLGVSQMQVSRRLTRSLQHLHQAAHGEAPAAARR